MAADLTQIATDLTALRAARTALGGSLTRATPSGVTAYNAALSTALSDVETALGRVEAHMAASDDSVGLVGPGVDGKINAAVFLSYLSAAEQAPHLIDLRNFVLRMERNAIIAEAG